MDDILKKLLSSELLSEETKAEITEQFEGMVAQLKEELALEVRTELAGQWVKERDDLIQRVDETVEGMVGAELEELKEDIARFRDLEAEFAEKLVEEKHRLADTLSEEIDQLVDKLDSFLEYRLDEEFSEWKEDIQVIRENDFGRRMFEAFTQEFNRSFVDEDAVQTKLSITEEKLRQATEKLFEMEETTSQAQRAQKMEQVLSSLTGSKREQMEIILSNVETGKLTEAYNRFIGRIIKEDTKESATPLNENKDAKTKGETKVVTGEVLEETKKDSSDKDSLANVLRLAGISV